MLSKLLLVSALGRRSLPKAVVALRHAAASTTVPSYAMPRLASRTFSSLRLQSIAIQDEDLTDIDDDLDIEDAESTSGFANQKPLADFDLSLQTLQNLERAGITHLFPVQVESFSTMMDGRDIMGRSKTGSGKTLAFALPIIERILSNPSRSKSPRAVAMLPTRELAQQVADEFRRIAPQLRVGLVVGGVSYTPQENELRRGIDILVGTPGRVVDMMDKGALDLSEIEVSVLDEADMMLKFGFQEEVETILGAMPESKQCVMWSATTPRWVHSIAKQFLNDPVTIDLVGEDNSKLPATVAHKAILVSRDSKDHVLENVLNLYSNGGQTLIFTETKQEADNLVASISSRNKGVRALHGDLSQGLRTSTMQSFRSGETRTLICTDIAARGLDIANVDLVIQYRMSNDQENFVHRAGRTGRAGRSGVNVVLFEARDVGDVRELERKFGLTFSHVAAPLPSQLLDNSMETVRAKLENVAFDGRKAFEDAAKAILDNEDERLHVVSSALALLAGFEEKGPTVYSMLTAQAHLQTLTLVGDRSWNADGISSFLKEVQVNVPFSKVVRGDSHVFYFDVPRKHVDAVLQHAETNQVDISIATEFPKITLSGLRTSNYSSRPPQNVRQGYGNNIGNNRFQRDSNNRNGSRFGSNDGYSNNRNNYSRNNNRGGSGGFDSGFSRSSNSQGGRKSSSSNGPSWANKSSSKWL
ncbi:unnamed protein product [Aphanomyces euteiches]